MQTLSQKKKIGLIAGAILLLTVVALVSTGRMSLSGLSSNAITSSNYICNEQNQAQNLSRYNQIQNDIVHANNKISIVSGEIKVLQEKINAHTVTIGQKQAQITTRPAEITRLNGLIAPLTTFINTKCNNPTGGMIQTCKNKKKERLGYQNEITKLNALESDIQKLQNEITTLKNKISGKENQIGMWQKKLSDYTLFKNRFEACDAELKIKPIITSPLMSGEVTMSGEIAPIISGEAQRRVSLYKFNIEVTTPGKISIDKVNFDTAGGPDGSIELSNLQLIELNGPTPLYNCTLENNSQQIVCIPHQTTAKFVVESRTAVYELSAMARIISPGSRKIYNVSKDGLIYNEGKTRADNRTTSIKINYAPSIAPVCGNGIKEGAEQCDDGNTTNGDGCDNRCKIETLTSCVDSDNGIDYSVKGFTTYTAPGILDTDNDTCVNETTLAEQYCDGNRENLQSMTTCTHGCNNGACKPSGPVAEVCEDLSVSPNITQGGGTVTYTCQSNMDILCILDPAFCKPKTYSVVLKNPAGTVVQTVTTPTGTLTVPETPTGTYTAECFVNGQTTIIDACKKPITNQTPVVACTGTLPTNASILVNVGNTSRAWTYDGSPTGPYQNCSFKCPTGTVYANNACNAPTGNLLVSLSSATPLTGYAAGGSTVVAAVFDFKAENIQHTVKQLKFKVGSSDATSAINSIQLYDGSNTLGSPSFFLGNNATIDALNLAIPANTTKTIIVRLTLNSIGTGAGISQSNVGLTLDEVTYKNSEEVNTTLITNPGDIVANAKYVYQSFPVLTQIAVNTSTKITNGTARDILKFSIAAPVTATTSNGISVKQIRFPISWIDGGGSSDTLEVESLKLSIDGTDITGTDISIQDQGGASVESTSGLTESDNYIIITWDSNKELTIGAGQVRTLTLRGTMQGFNTSDQETNPADSFTIGFEPDYVHNDTKRYLVNHAPTDNIINLSATPDGSSGSVRYSFLWSDNSSAAHTGAINTGSSNDWANSYPILSPFSSQTFTNSNI